MTATYTQPRRSPHIARLLCAAFLLLPILSAMLNAQMTPENDSDLFFPPKLKVEAFASTKIYPEDARKGRPSESSLSEIMIVSDFTSKAEAILPMIFFDGAGSIAIPERYQIFHSTRQADSYTDSSDALQIVSESRTKYYQVLNIIGYRMSQFPESTIELQGYYSTLPGEEIYVGTARGEVVQDYLTSVWRIAPERIILRPAQQACDSSDNFARQAEAQRVTIIAADWRLVQPVQYFQISNARVFIHFHFTVDPSMPATEMEGIEITLSAEDKLLCQAEIPTHIDSTIYRLQGIWPGFALRSQGTEALVVRAAVRRKNGTPRYSDPVRIPIVFDDKNKATVYRREYFNALNYTLPFFEVRDSSLSLLQQHHLTTYCDSLQSQWDIAATDFRMVLEGACEVSENQGFNVDVAEAQRIESEYDVVRGKETRKMFSSNQQSIIFYDRSSDVESDSLYRVWLGEELFQERINLEVYTPPPPRDFSKTLQEDLWLDTLAKARATTVGTYIRQNLRINSFCEMRFYTKRSALRFSHRPEDRYYNRLIDIRLIANPFGETVPLKVDSFPQTQRKEE